MSKRTRRKPEPPVFVHVEMYRLHVIVYMGWSVKMMLADGRRHGITEDCYSATWLQNLNHAHDTAAGYCTHFGGNGNADVLIWLRERPLDSGQYRVLWHEVSHCIDRIAEHVDPGNALFDASGGSEARACLLEFILGKITKDLWNRK